MKKPVNIFLLNCLVLVPLLLWGTAPASFAQAPDTLRLSLSYQQAPVNEVLAQLSKAHSLNFSYFNTLPLNRKVTVDIQNATLDEALGKIFAHTGLDYAVTGDQIVVKNMLQKLQLQGSIRDGETGEPLALATVSIKGRQMGMVTNQQGEFGLLVPQQYRDDTLFVSMLGYDNYRVSMAELNEKQKLNIVLKPANYLLKEITVRPDEFFVQEIKPEKPQKRGGTASVIFKNFVTVARYSIDASTLSYLQVSAGAGELHLLPAEVNEIEVEAEIITTSISAATNQKFIDRYLNLKISEKSDSAFLNSGFRILKKKLKKLKNREGYVEAWTFPMGEALATPGSKINLVVKVPPGLRVEIFDNSGEILVEGLQNPVTIYDDSGGIQVEKMSGNVKIVDDSGEITVKNLKGDLYISDDSGGMQVKNISGSLEIHDRSGGILLDNVGTDTTTARSIFVKDRSGRLEMHRARSDVELSDRSGKLLIKGVEGDVKISDRSGEIIVEEIKGKVKLKDRSGRVKKQP